MTRGTGMRPLRLAMIGQKAIPARFGGVETHVENIGTRLAERGHEVWAFCRSRFRPEKNGTTPADGYRVAGGEHSYRGVHLAYRPSINTKHCDAASHTLLCAFESGMLHNFDVVHFHGIGPSAFSPLTRAMGPRVACTFHALDWRQVKWGRRAKRALVRGESMGARRSDGVIAVSRIMQRYVREQYGVDATYIPNGATIPDAVPSTDPLARWGLEADNYVLTVGRIIPDREIDTLIAAFNRLTGDTRLVVVGSESPRTEYSNRLRDLAGDRVVFTGDVFGPALESLYAHCRVYVLASRVEGLPITVCEAMAHSRALLLSDIAENQEVGGDAVNYFKCGDDNALQAALQQMTEDAGLRRSLGERALERARGEYNWDVITDQVESFYYRMLRASR